VGVPDITPVEVASERPFGKLPEVIDHTYGGVPLAAWRVCEYDVPTVAPLRDVVVMVGDETKRGFWVRKTS